MAGGIRDNAGDDMAESHEINVTPFIDVMLVLLIIFMVAAPLSTVDVKVDLPASNSQPEKRPEKPMYLTLQKDLSVHLGDTPVARDALAPALDGVTGADREQRVFLRADAGVPYGDLMELMNLLRNAGYLKISLVGLETIGAAGAAGMTVAPVPLAVPPVDANHPGTIGR